MIELDKDQEDGLIAALRVDMSFHPEEEKSIEELKTKIIPVISSLWGEEKAMEILEKLTVKEETKENMAKKEITDIAVGDVYIATADFKSEGAEVNKDEYLRIEKVHDTDEYNIAVSISARAAECRNIIQRWIVEGDAIRRYCIEYVDPNKTVKHEPAKEAPFRRMQPDEFRRALAKHG